MEGLRGRGRADAAVEDLQSDGLPPSVGCCVEED